VIPITEDMIDREFDEPSAGDPIRCRGCGVYFDYEPDVMVRTRRGFFCKQCRENGHAGDFYVY